MGKNSVLSTAKRVCVSASESNTWHPAQLTTYVLSVYEIEQLISALKSKVTSVLSTVDASSKDAASLQKQVSNWQAVLSDYRSHNTGKLTSPFQRETSLFMNAVKAYNSWSSSADANNDGSFQGVLDKSISELSNYGHPSKDTYGSSHPLFLSRIDQSMRALETTPALRPTSQILRALILTAMEPLVRPHHLLNVTPTMRSFSPSVQSTLVSLTQTL